MADQKLTDKGSLSSFDDSDLIHVVDTDPVCLDKFNGIPNILPSLDSSDALYDATTIFLAIKPQFIREVVKQIKPLITN